MNDQYAVLGNPINHSKSPMIHAAFAKQTNQAISYEAILAPIDGFADVVNRLIAKGYKGVNVTVPFKFEAYQLCKTMASNGSLSTRAINSRSGAVNTLSFVHGAQIHGDNTDGIGLRNDLEQNLDFTLADKDILILGAGGAAHGVLSSLVGAKRITIANRTPQKALDMVSGVANARATTFDALDQSFDLVINATSAGLTDSVLPIPNCVFTSNTLAYDMMYGRETPFMTQARLAGAQVADGLGMLVEQAAEAFYLWREVRPDTAPVIQMIRSL